MIEFKNGDLLTETGLFGICHQCNCFSRMGSGIAKSIAAMHPNAAAVDKYSQLTPEAKLGSYTEATSRGPDGKPLRIFNLYGQYHYGTDSMKTDYFELENALVHLKHRLSFYSFCTRIGIPYGMGCGLAGGDWKIVEQIVRNVFEKDIHITIVIIRKD